MKKYFETFNVVEVQKTFYRPPSISTARKWRDAAPSDFEFSVKAWQIITHPPSSPTYRKAKIEVEEGGFFKPVKEVFEAWEVTREIAKTLKASFVIFQTPKSFRESKDSIDNMKEFFGSIDREFYFGWEARGWSEEGIKSVCEELDLVHVVDPFVMKPLHGDILYFRLHGFDYKHKYTDEELKRLAEFCSDLNCYVMFNNVHMFNDALRFRKLVSLPQSDSNSY
jgi:uncharacterized protein YecE (DUF72 family)